MLSVDYRRLGVGPGVRVLDLGCGPGRHSVEAMRLGARCVSIDLDGAEVAAVRASCVAAEAMLAAPLAGGPPIPVRADVTRLPLASGSVDVVIASEVFEHVPDDRDAFSELARVVRPGGRVAVTVPRAMPERVCWMLSNRYHDRPGGHVRIYAGDELRRRLRSAGLLVTGWAHAHALHTPYWWMRCALGVDDEARLPTRLYHRLLVWDLMHRPAPTRVAERLLNPMLGKSLVIYCERPAEAGMHGGAAAA